MAERLTAADASNIAMDTPHYANTFLMAGVLAPGGFVAADGEADLVALRAAVADRIPAAPRLAQRVRRLGHALVWEPVRLDLDGHVRRVAAVDGQLGFERLCARLIVRPLPLDRPLWELLIVPGVASDRTGVVFRVHHAMADGAAAVLLAQALMDPVAASGTDVARRTDGTARSGAVKSGAMQSTSVQSTSVRSGSVQSGSVRSESMRSTGARAGGWFRTLTSGFERSVAIFRPAVPRIALLGDVGPRRAVAFVDVGLDALAAGARTEGATVNDALLIAVAAAARSALLARGERPPPTLPASVPVALGGRGRSGNAVGVMLVPLPTDQADVARRLRGVAALTRAGKDDARSRGTHELTRTRWGTWLFMRLVRHQRLTTMFVTNVHGPRRRLALAGAPLERIWPVAALGGNVRLGFAAISYDGAFRCAVHCDADILAVEVIARTLRNELAGIAALA